MNQNDHHGVEMNLDMSMLLFITRLGSLSSSRLVGIQHYVSGF